MLVIVVFFAIAHYELLRGHITIGLVVSRLRQRAQDVIDSIMYVFFLVTFSFSDVYYHCFFMESIVVMILTVPIIFPVLLALGIDPVWFGVLVVVTIMMGNVTPPVGVTVYTVGGLVRDVPLFTLRGWFVACMLFFLVGNYPICLPSSAVGCIMM